VPRANARVPVAAFEGSGRTGGQRRPLESGQLPEWPEGRSRNQALVVDPRPEPGCHPLISGQAYALNDPLRDAEGRTIGSISVSAITAAGVEFSERESGAQVLVQMR
jgi:hypothetical protein